MTELFEKEPHLIQLRYSTIKRGSYGKVVSGCCAAVENGIKSLNCIRWEQLNTILQ